jgi:hypothetical protein
VLVRRRVVGATVGELATWLTVVLALRPGTVETLFLAIVFVAVPAVLDGPLDIERNDRLIDVARRGHVPAGLALAVSLVLPPSPTAFFLALPWAAITACLGMSAVRDRAARGWHLDAALIPQGALGFAAIGGLLVLDHRVGADPLGFSQFLVLLAGVHFTVAGFVLLASAEALRQRRGGRAPVVAGSLAIVGGPLTAIGFFGLPGVNIAGALATATAGLIVGGLHLDAARSLPRPAGPLLALAGGSLLITMPMAATWAIGLLIGAELLPLDLMTRVHGGLNAMGFAIPASIGWRLVERRLDARSLAGAA